MKRWLGVLLIAIPDLAVAAGLGPLSLQSSLGQPFRAQIELVAQDSELARFATPRIASPEAFREAGLQYGPAISGMRVSLKKPAAGRSRLEVTSIRPVNEPAIVLLIEVDWDSTSIRRAYTVLLDPPGLSPAATTSAMPASPEDREAPIVHMATRPERVDPGATRGAAPAPKAAAPVVRSERAEGGSPAGSKAAPASDMLPRLRSLEEKSASDRQALDGLLARATVLEKTVRGMEEAVEACKRCVAAQTKPVPVKPSAQNGAPTKPEAVVAAKPEAVPAKPEAVVAAKPEAVPAKPEAVVAAKPEAVPAKPEAVVAAKPEAAPAKPEIVAAAEPAAVPPPEPKQKVERLAAVTPKSAPPQQSGGEILTPPAPPGPADFLDDGSMAVAAGGSVVLLGGLAYWIVRRRRRPEVTSEDMVQKLLSKDPSREDLQLKLLKIFAERGDVIAYQRVASEFKQTAGTGSKNWGTVVAMGRMLDPKNPLYEAPSITIDEGPSKAG